ncbi:MULTISPECIES: DsbA family oxidoreductase [unclassified Streptomyces]|uniref:DsbA family oxidoreductase n=1 Tax=unclassified Streptomyces TaxID=2593676 RepID=UPI000CD58D74|nr:MULTISPECIES: DsbA family oxidoreductase [unclassified Streptomyces]
MRIEIWADVVCAWAYIGKRRVERALAGRDEDNEVVWRPFRIDPTAPAGAVALEEALRDPLMDEALRACAPGLTPAQNRVRISEVAATEGLGPNWGSPWRVSSHDAHRLIALAYEHGGAGLQDAVAEAVMRANFLHSMDIGDRAVLGSVAASAGFPQGAALLHTDAGEALVAELLLQGKARGVRTSPTLVVGDRALGGAQSPRVIAEFLARGRPGRAVPAEVERLRWAESLLDRRDPLGALVLLRPLMEEFGADRGVRLLAARACFASAQLRRARALLEAVVEETPADPYARMLYGRTLQRLGLDEEARVHLRLADPASGAMSGTGG